MISFLPIPLPTHTPHSHTDQHTGGSERNRDQWLRGGQLKQGPDLWSGAPAGTQRGRSGGQEIMAHMCQQTPGYSY